MNQKSELLNLRNLGSTSVRWLNDIGIFTVDELRDRGAVEAYCLIKAQRENVSLNLLYALFGALYHMAWNQIPDNKKLELKKAVDAFRFL